MGRLEGDDEKVVWRVGKDGTRNRKVDVERLVVWREEQEGWIRDTGKLEKGWRRETDLFERGTVRQE